MISIAIGAILKFGNISADVEIANTPELQRKGLMGRSSLEENQGMLFIYDEPQALSFWMKNTLTPLSIAFFESEKRLIEVKDMEPPHGKQFPLPIYQCRVPCQFALEMKKGWFEKNQIQLGTKFTLQDSK